MSKKIEKRKLRDLTKDELVDIVRKHRDYINYAKVSTCTIAIVLLVMQMAQAL